MNRVFSLAQVIIRESNEKAEKDKNTAQEKKTCPH